MNDDQLRALVCAKLDEISVYDASVTRELTILVCEQLYYRGKNDGLDAAQQILNRTAEEVRS